MSTADIVVLVTCAFTSGWALGAVWVIWRWVKEERSRRAQ